MFFNFGVLCLIVCCWIWHPPHILHLCLCVFVCVTQKYTHICVHTTFAISFQPHDRNLLFCEFVYVLRYCDIIRIIHCIIHLRLWTLNCKVVVVVVVVVFFFWLPFWVHYGWCCIYSLGWIEYVVAPKSPVER